jgi:hypothetical protein
VGRIHSFARRSTNEKRTLVEVTLLLGAIRIGLIVLPFKTLRRTLDRLAGNSKSRTTIDPDYQSRVVWATNSASRYVLPDKPCLTQALTVQLLLRRKGIPTQLRIGVMKDEEKNLQAHAWVESEGDVVIGGPRSELKKYKPLPAFDVELL